MSFVKPLDSDQTVQTIQKEYATKLIYYPLQNSLSIPVGVYVTEQIYTFWDTISVYLPYGSKLAKAYVRPEDQALIGLNKLKELNPIFDFDSISVKRLEAASQSQDTNSGSSFFSGSSTPTANPTATSTLTKTHPALNGKFGDYYLFQFNYNSLQAALASKGFAWVLPYGDPYQKGLALDIDLSEVKVDINLVLQLITSIVNQNAYLNVKTCTLLNKTITVTFNTSVIPSFPFDFGILNVGSSSNVSDCFSQTVLDKIYKHLKDNGYGDLEESVGAKSLKGLPTHVRRKGTALATAIRDSLIDVLGGSDGLFSVMQSSTNEYLMGIINGLVAANKVVYDELDRIGGGSVKEKAIDAFQSGINRATVSKGVLSLLNNGMEINQTTGKSLLSTEPSITVQGNVSMIKTDLSAARTQDNLS